MELPQEGLNIEDSMEIYVQLIGVSTTIQIRKPHTRRGTPTNGFVLMFVDVPDGFGGSLLPSDLNALVVTTKPQYLRALLPATMNPTLQ